MVVGILVVVEVVLVVLIRRWFVVLGGRGGS